VRIRVAATEEGLMLGNLLARRIPELDLERARELVRAGGVYCGGIRTRTPQTRVVEGERIEVHLAADTRPSFDPEALHVVHHADDLLIAYKPPGVPVQATRTSARGTLAEGVRRWLERQGVARPYVGVVHRLDQRAEGLVLFTVRSALGKSVHRMFVEHRIERTYLAEVHGEAPTACELDAPIVETATGARLGHAHEPGAKPARTTVTRLELRPASEGVTSLVRAELSTGRTHQVRLHLAGAGLPIVGDHRYGRDAPAPAPAGPGTELGDDDDGTAAPHDPLRLCAAALRFSHPRTGAPLAFAAPLPAWAANATLA
jgi:23S rRNA pseudouridine1911/1915/1917 synthase